MSHGISVPPDAWGRRGAGTPPSPRHGLSHAIPPLSCSCSWWLVFHSWDKVSRLSGTFTSSCTGSGGRCWLGLRPAGASGTTCVWGRAGCSAHPGGWARLRGQGRGNHQPPPQHRVMVPEPGAGERPHWVPALHPRDKASVCLNRDGSGMELAPLSPHGSRCPVPVRARSPCRLGYSKALTGPSCPGCLAILCTQWQKGGITRSELVDFAGWGIGVSSGIGRKEHVPLFPLSPGWGP